MTVKDIAQQYCPSDVPVHYHNGGNRELYFSTRLLTIQELRALGKHPKEDIPIGVWLPDSSIDDAFDMLDNQSHDNTELLLDLSKSNLNLPSDIDEKFLVVLFSVLHEFGHWEHYIKSGLSRTDYAIKYIVPEGVFMAKYQQSVLSAKSKDEALSLYRSFAKRYRQIPMEAAADEYALSAMQKIIDREVTYESCVSLL